MQSSVSPEELANILKQTNGAADHVQPPPATPPQKPLLTRMVGGAVAGLVVYGLIQVFGSPATAKQDPGAAPPSATTRPLVETINVTLQDVDDDFRRNPVAGKLKYANKRLLFNGFVAGVSADGDSVAVGLLLPSTMCYLRSGQEAAAAKLVPYKSKVWLAGRVRGIDRVLEVNDCEILDQRSLVE